MSGTSLFQCPKARAAFYRRLLQRHRTGRAIVAFTYVKDDGSIGVGRAAGATREAAAAAALRLYPAATISEPDVA